jgi:hypothetical protein
VHDQRRAQWALHVIVWHGPSFGHQITIETQPQGREPWSQSAGSWKGIGLPGDVLQGARAMLDSIFTEHLVTRYGIQDELPFHVVSEGEPF